MAEEKPDNLEKNPGAVGGTPLPLVESDMAELLAELERMREEKDPVFMEEEARQLRDRADRKYEELVAKGWVLQSEAHKKVKEIRPDVTIGLISSRTRRLESGKKYLINGAEMPKDYQGTTSSKDELVWYYPYNKKMVLICPEYAAGMIADVKKYVELTDEKLGSEKWVLQSEVQRKVEEIRPGANGILVASRTRRLESGKKYLINGKEAPEDYQGETYSHEELLYRSAYDKDAVLLHPKYAAAMIEADKQVKTKTRIQPEESGEVIREEIKKKWERLRNEEKWLTPAEASEIMQCGLTIISYICNSIQQNKLYTKHGKELPNSQPGSVLGSQLVFQNPFNRLFLLSPTFIKTISYPKKTAGQKDKTEMRHASGANTNSVKGRYKDLYEDIYNEAVRQHDEDPYKPVIIDGHQIKCGYYRSKTNQPVFCFDCVEERWIKKKIGKPEIIIRERIALKKGATSTTIGDITSPSQELTEQLEAKEPSQKRKK